jgi:excisionase family DNA binding protein
MRLQQEILNVEQLAVLLAVPKSTVYKLVRDGRIPGHKVGRHCRFSHAAVLRWMEESTPHSGESAHLIPSQEECHADR